MPRLTASRIGIETLRALVVLALVFLSFAGGPAAAGAPGAGTTAVASGISYCGDAPDEPGAHAPCHACRTDGATGLPPAPVAVLPVVRFAEVGWGALPGFALPAYAGLRFSARGPPAA